MPSRNHSDAAARPHEPSVARLQPVVKGGRPLRNSVWMGYMIHMYVVFGCDFVLSRRTTADLFRDRNTRAARRIPRAPWRVVQRKLKLWMPLQTE